MSTNEPENIAPADDREAAALNDVSDIAGASDPAGEEPVAGFKPRLDRRLRVALLTVLGLVVGGLLIAAGATWVTGTSTVCYSCHEMRPTVASWRTSAHAHVPCYSCHQTPRPWYRFPETLAGRAAMLTRDFTTHTSPNGKIGMLGSEINSRSIPDAACLRCHDLDRTVTLKSGTLIQHKKHARRNKSCISCHFYTAHPTTDLERPLQLMRRCFQCHGRGKAAKAPGKCSTCHPKSFSARPESHADATWKRRHGETALADRALCAMCHKQKFCDACHGLRMPHAAGWAESKTGHQAYAKTDAKVCEHCHTGKPDICSMCHHKGYDRSNGPWVKHHNTMVNKHGAAFCLKCHKSVFCTKCHKKRKVLHTGF